LHTLVPPNGVYIYSIRWFHPTATYRRIYIYIYIGVPWHPGTSDVNFHEVYPGSMDSLVD
jgi:hypothetical protein